MEVTRTISEFGKTSNNLICMKPEKFSQGEAAGDPELEGRERGGEGGKEVRQAIMAENFPDIIKPISQF